jgi:hypothetical protein
MTADCKNHMISKSNMIKVIVIICCSIFLSNSGFGQISGDIAHDFINELITDNYKDRCIEILDSVPYNDKLKISGSYLQQNLELINSYLKMDEIKFILDFCDSTRCYADFDTLNYQMQLCDTSFIHITEIDKRFQIGFTPIESKFHWDKTLIKTKGNKRKTLGIKLSEPVLNESNSIMLIHIVKRLENGYGWSGNTILFKKINGKWIEICKLSGWTT